MLPKNGALTDDVTAPENPAAQKHPSGTLDPTLFCGQEMAKHEELQKGDVMVADTLPANPALQVHPDAVSIPELLAGQGTATHVVL